MSDIDPHSIPEQLVHDLSRCMVCQKLASFGFTTRHGTIWKCWDHREAGKRVLVPPNGQRETS